MDKTLINSELEKIITSNTFLKAESGKQLLVFLTKATLEGVPIKEFKIADELFHKDNDSGVRAYILNLRKKLDEYYLHEGKDDKVIFSIPKGQYFVKFEERTKRNAFRERLKTFFSNKFVLLIILSVLLVVSIILIRIFFFTDKLQRSAIWHDMLNPKEKMILVVGDNYFFGAKVATGTKGLMRDFNINSDSEFDSQLNAKPWLKDSVYKINYTYMTKQGAISVFTIMPHIKHYENISLMLSSELQYEDIKQKDILFMGKYNTLWHLDYLVGNQYFKIDAGMLHFLSKDSTINRRIIIDNIKKEDYSIVLKFKTPYGKNIMLFLAADDPGVIATINYFLKYENITELEKKLELTKSQNSFKALFKITGLVRTDMSIEFLSGEKL